MSNFGQSLEGFSVVEVVAERCDACEAGEYCFTHFPRG